MGKLLTILACLTVLIAGTAFRYPSVGLCHCSSTVYLSTCPCEQASECLHCEEHAPCPNCPDKIAFEIEEFPLEGPLVVNEAPWIERSASFDGVLNVHPSSQGILIQPDSLPPPDSGTPIYLLTRKLRI